MVPHRVHCSAVHAGRGARDDVASMWVAASEGIAKRSIRTAEKFRI